MLADLSLRQIDAEWRNVVVPSADDGPWQPVVARIEQTRRSVRIGRRFHPRPERGKLIVFGNPRPVSIQRVRKTYLVEATGAGVAVFDYDGDGLSDIFLVNGTRWSGAGKTPSRLYHNEGNLRFKQALPL